jgi:hypothetical protein
MGKYQDFVGWHRREMFRMVKILLIQPLKRQKMLPNLKHQLKNSLMIHEENTKEMNV